MRFNAFVVVDENGCWLWQGSLSHNGYADRISAYGKRWRPTHFALFMKGLDVPSGMEVDHLCRTKSCVRPDHLEIVTRSENERRKHLALEQGFCRNGHAKTPENLYTARGRRECRQCRREARSRSSRKKAS